MNLKDSYHEDQAFSAFLLWGRMGYVGSVCFNSYSSSPLLTFVFVKIQYIPFVVFWVHSCPFHSNIEVSRGWNVICKFLGSDCFPGQPCRLEPVHPGAWVAGAIAHVSRVFSAWTSACWLTLHPCEGSTLSLCLGPGLLTLCPSSLSFAVHSGQCFIIIIIIIIIVYLRNRRRMLLSTRSFLRFHHGQGWAKMKLGARNPVQAFHTGGGDPRTWAILAASPFAYNTLKLGAE